MRYVVTHFLEIACQQVMVEILRFFRAMDRLLHDGNQRFLRKNCFVAIWPYQKCTLTLIRPVTLAYGVEFRLIGTWLNLISFCRRRT
jgi:hypothetical protein